MPNRVPARPHLTVSTESRRHFILVPSAHASALRSYPSNHGIPSSPPEPSTVGFDTVELAARTDLEGVQALLDRWAQKGPSGR